MNPMRTIDCNKIKEVKEGEGLSFYMLVAGENGMQDAKVGFQAENAERKAVWVDGLCLALGLQGASSSLMEEINRLLDVEVELKMLDMEQETKPPIPPPPPDCKKKIHDLSCILPVLLFFFSPSLTMLYSGLCWWATCPGCWRSLVVV